MQIGLLGVGTVGSGVVELLAGREDICVARMLVRTPRAGNTTVNPDEVLGEALIDTIVETIGGTGAAAEYAFRALHAGKHFVTANKALVAAHGAELDVLAREKNAAFLFGAACGGGIPFLRNLADARRVERITAVGGILNGTTNYMLDLMQRGGGGYADARSRAQQLGYAERDPSADVDGTDAARKLCLACGTAFDALIGEAQIPTAGIRNVRAEDIAYIRAAGRVCRLTARAGMDEGALYAVVEPTLVEPASPEAGVSLNWNIAWYEGAFGGRRCFVGQGAGKLPTASNVVLDLQDISAGRRHMFTGALAPARVENARQHRRYLLCLPETADCPAEIEREELRAERRYVFTRPARVEFIHEAMKKIDGAFFAGIEE